MLFDLFDFVVEALIESLRNVAQMKDHYEAAAKN